MMDPNRRRWAALVLMAGLAGKFGPLPAMTISASGWPFSTRKVSAAWIGFRAAMNKTEWMKWRMRSDQGMEGDSTKDTFTASR